MDNEWRVTEHTASVAAAFADRWATAAAAQARRIEHPENLFERVPDTFLQIDAIHNVLRAAEMARDSLEPGGAKDRVTQAIDAFLVAIVVGHGPDLSDRQALKLARNVLEHFDAYYCGTGDRQRADAARSSESREELAQRYRVDLGGPSAARPHLLIGMKPDEPLVEIDLAEPAAHAARQLAAELGFAAGSQASLEPSNTGLGGGCHQARRAWGVSRLAW
jgi:hypothetical protein